MGPGALETALALYQTPSLAAATRLRPVPADVFEVIRIAAGDVEATDASVARSGAAPAVVREASQLYLKHVLFDPDADHYRVLGVAADADVAQMGEHRRWLLKWLHPDRADEWDAVYAARVQQAWHQLRDPDRRAGYDESRLDPDDWGPVVGAPALRPVWTARALGAGDSPPQRPGVGTWAAAAGLPALVLAMAWVMWPSGGQPSPDRQDLTVASGMAGGGLYVLERVPLPDTGDSLQAAVAASTQTSTQTSAAGATPAAQQARAPAPTAQVAGTPDTSPPPATAGTPAIAPTAALTDAGRTERATDATLAGSAAADPSPSTTPETPAARTPAPAPAHIDADAVETVLLAFRAAYEQGDIDALMAVFTDDAVNRRGGREAIRQDYVRLFRSSRQRRLQWHSLKWQPAPDHALGEGGFVASITPRRGATNTVRGRVRVEVVEQRGQVRIRELWHEDQVP